jgi:hypothetical protein
MDTINLLHEVTNAMKQLQNENAELRNQMATFKAQLDHVNQTMDHEKHCREEQKERLDKVESQVERTLESKYEKYYQRHLERMLGAGHSITKHGYTDIETEDAIYEIKRQNHYKNVVGQLKAYGVGKDHKRLVAALFGDIPPTKEPEIVSLLNANQIYVIKLIDLPDGSVLMKEIGKKVGEESADHNNFKWFDKHVKYEPGKLLEKKELNKLFFKDSVVGNARKSSFKKQFYYWLATRFSNRPFIEVDTTIDGKSFKGWTDLCIKTE